MDLSFAKSALNFLPLRSESFFIGIAWILGKILRMKSFFFSCNFVWIRKSVQRNEKWKNKAFVLWRLVIFLGNVGGNFFQIFFSWNSYHRNWSRSTTMANRDSRAAGSVRGDDQPAPDQSLNRNGQGSSRVPGDSLNFNGAEIHDGEFNETALQVWDCLFQQGYKSPREQDPAALYQTRPLRQTWENGAVDIYFSIIDIVQKLKKLIKKITKKI